MGKRNLLRSVKCGKHAKSSGKPCTRWAIPGGTVCRWHGGAAPQVKRKAAERLADLIDPDRALREGARLAYSDIRELFDEHGNLRPIKSWPDHLAAAVASVEIVKKNLAAGDGQTDIVHKLKLWDKPKNLEMLFKHLGLLIDQHKHTHTFTLEDVICGPAEAVTEKKD